MTSEYPKEFEEGFEENWQSGQEAIDAVMQVWKEQDFTRKDVVARLLSSLVVVEGSQSMHCFMIAILAERLTRTRDEQTINE